MIIQEAALKQMDQRVKELEAQVAQLQQTANGQQSSGGFRPACSAAAAAVRQARVNSIRRSSKIRRPEQRAAATHSRSSQPMPNRSRRHLRAPAASVGLCKPRRASPAAWYWPTC